MNLDEAKRKLEDLTSRRSKVLNDAARIRGRAEQAKQSLATLDNECRQKSLNPEKLDETVELLKQKFLQELNDFEASVKKAESDLAPFLTKY